ncbi:MAG: FMN-binding protein [Oscillospiraceae bacterium]
MLENIKPPLVLSLICAVICALLIAAYNATYVDTTGVITDKLQECLDNIYGHGEYQMAFNDDGSLMTYDGISAVIFSDNGDIAFEIVADGYSKGGIDVIVGMDSDGAVKGIQFVSLKETPGLGTKVNDNNFISQFLGLDSSEFDIQAVTGATFSSNGMKNAVACAIDTYNNHREEIMNAVH